MKDSVGNDLPKRKNFEEAEGQQRRAIIATNAFLDAVEKKLRKGEYVLYKAQTKSALVMKGKEIFGYLSHP